MYFYTFPNECFFDYLLIILGNSEVSLSLLYKFGNEKPQKISIHRGRFISKSQFNLQGSCLWVDLSGGSFCEGVRAGRHTAHCGQL